MTITRPQGRRARSEANGEVDENCRLCDRLPVAFTSKEKKTAPRLLTQQSEMNVIFHNISSCRDRFFRYRAISREDDLREEINYEKRVERENIFYDI